MTLAYEYLQRFIEQDKKMKKASNALASRRFIEVNSVEDVSALMLLHKTEKWNGWVKVAEVYRQLVMAMAMDCKWYVKVIDGATKGKRKKTNPDQEGYTALEAAATTMDFEKFRKKMTKREVLAKKLATMENIVVKNVEDVEGLLKIRDITSWNGRVSIFKTAPGAVVEMVVDAKFRIQWNQEKVQTPLRQGLKRKK